MNDSESCEILSDSGALWEKGLVVPENPIYAIARYPLAATRSRVAELCAFVLILPIKCSFLIKMSEPS